MAIVFINDHPFYVDKQQDVFTSGTLNAEVWSRFTDNFGALTVIGRGIALPDQTHNHKRASAKNVTFDLLYQIKGGMDYFKYKRDIVEKLTPYILNSEFIVIRLPSNIGVIAANLCKKYNKKYYVEVVGCAFDSMWFFGNLAAKVLAPLSFYKNKNAIKNANAAVYVTKEYLQKRYPTTHKEINASNVVIESFDDVVLKNHLSYLNANKKPKLIGMIGSIALPYKGYEILFRALQKVTVSYELHIVGGGDSKWIEKQIELFNLKGKVFLKGRLNSRAEIYQFLDHLDLYVQPSLTEGLPRSVIEAMSRACPIIASQAGGIPELIESQKTYPVKDAEKLAALINSTLNDVEELRRLSEENFYNSKNYTFETINKRRNVFLQEIKQEIRN